MADRVLIALPDGRWLALDRENFSDVWIAGAEEMASARPIAVTDIWRGPKR